MTFSNRLGVKLQAIVDSDRRSTTRLAAAALTIAVLGFGGCAQSPPQVATNHHSKEYFPSSVYGPASRRVIADGQPVPHGGGQYLVGKPYTIAGQTYYPSERKITQVGLASWYGDAFHGRLTANGEIYDRDGFTAAHPTMPLPSYARVTNLRNNHSMIVRVNDRGPYHSNRVMDVSRRVAEALDFQRGGTSMVKVEYVGRASLAGSDDARLFATLRTNGPARTQGMEETTMVAEATPPPARVASLAPYAPQPTSRPRSVADDESSAEPGTSHVRHAPPVRTSLREESVERTPDPTGTLRRSARRSDKTDLKEANARTAYPATARNDGKSSRPDHRVSMAFRGNAGDARAFAARALMPAARPGRVAAALPARPEPKDLTRARIGAPRVVALPPARPVRLAAASPVASHHGAGSHLPHSRDD